MVTISYPYKVNQTKVMLCKCNLMIKYLNILYHLIVSINFNFIWLILMITNTHLDDKTLHISFQAFPILL